MNQHDLNKPEVQENPPRAIAKGIGAFCLALFLALLTVVIIYL